MSKRAQPRTINEAFSPNYRPGRSAVLYLLAHLEAERVHRLITLIEELKTSARWWRDLSAAQREECNALLPKLQAEYKLNVANRSRANKAIHSMLMERRKRNERASVAV